MRCTLVILCCLLVTLCVGERPVLRTREDGTFRIVQFTDLHYGESFVADVASSAVQYAVLVAENPDLVIMTGDSVSGYGWDGKSKNWFPPHWEVLTEPMKVHNTKWAFTFGNHDDQADYTRAQIIALDQKNNLSLTQAGPSNINGSTNYFLPVFSHDPSNTVPVAILWMLDSSDDNCEGVTGWGCVYPNQIQWYIDTTTALRQKYGKIIPGMAFFHIPVPEFLTMWNGNTCQGQLEDTGVCCFSVNTGLFAAFKQMGDIISVHCGHDHNNDFYGYYEGIMLAYGRKTGYGGYGPPKDWLRGARVLEIQESPFGFTHWIRQQDGTVVESQAQPVHPPPPANNITWQYCCGTTQAGGSSNCLEYAQSFAEHVHQN